MCGALCRKPSGETSVSSSKKSIPHSAGIPAVSWLLFWTPRIASSYFFSRPIRLAEGSRAMECSFGTVNRSPRPLTATIHSSRFWNPISSASCNSRPPFPSLRCHRMLRSPPSRGSLCSTRTRMSRFSSAAVRSSADRNQFFLAAVQAFLPHLRTRFTRRLDGSQPRSPSFR